jgi:hypothetical protein
MNAEVTKDAATTAAPLTPAAYNAFVGAAILRDIRLIKSDFSLNEMALDVDLADGQMHQTCEIESAEYDTEVEMMAAWVVAEATCKKKSKKIAALRCQYLIMYDVQRNPEQGAVDAFARRVARFAAYPYFRAHFAEVCSQAGLRLPPLPVIKETRLIPNDQPKPSTRVQAKEPKAIAGS